MDYKPSAWAWHQRAACNRAPEADQEAFTGHAPTKDIAQDIARRYCDRCPVKAQCYAWAYSEHLFAGIAGGAAFSEQKSAGQRRLVMPIPPVKERKNA